MIPINPFTLKGKVLLVTGASSGIGKQIAIECSKMGAILIITGRNKARLNNTFNQLTGEKHIQIIADLGSDTDFELLVSKITSLDGIVHAAGIVNPKPFLFLSKKELDSIMNVNFTWPVLLTNSLLRKKLIKNNASIIFISSIAGVLCSSVGNSSYSASKGALNGIIKGMALELAPKRIRINSILPGMIDTGIFDESSISQEQIEVDKKRYPLGRYGNPEDVAYATIYLLSDASSWVTGSNLLIDGGYTLI